jgi:ABC-2 type transport system ATP-binding protein
VAIIASRALTKRTRRDYGSFTRALPRIALRERIRVRQVLPCDGSLESVFPYLVGAR